MSDVTRRDFVLNAGAGAALLATAAPILLADNDQPIRVGCVGIGNRGTSLLKGLLQIPNVQVVAICDIKKEKLDAAAKAITAAGKTAPKQFENWKELLAFKDVDAVVSALPIDLHAANYVDTITAGKDLYGEKPLALSVEDCNKVVKAANDSKQIVQIGFQRRASAFFNNTMTDVHNGELGDIVEGRVAWSNSWGPLGDWFGQRERSGDWMIEQACHNWDVLNWALKSMPKRAVGFGRKGLFKEFQGDRNVTDYYSALIEYENGTIINMVHSWLSPGQNGQSQIFNYEHTRLIGTKAGIDFNSGTISYRKELKKPDRTVQGNFKYDDITVAALSKFFESVRSRKKPVATVEHGRDATLVGLLVRKAVDESRMVDMKELT